jgi:uncharacterized Zn finger protein
MRGAMEKKMASRDTRKCPWCSEMTEPEIKVLKKEWGNVRETRCANCGKVVAAYLVEEGDFMSGIRAFPNQ